MGLYQSRHCDVVNDITDFINDDSFRNCRSLGKKLTDEAVVFMIGNLYRIVFVTVWMEVLRMRLVSVMVVTVVKVGVASGFLIVFWQMIVMMKTRCRRGG